jgi:hypothetical protein
LIKVRLPLVLLCACSAWASTNFVTNGDFSTIAMGGPTSSFSLEDSTASETALVGWTLGNTSPLTSNQVLNCVVMGGTNTDACGTKEFGGNFSYWVNPGESPDGGNYYAADGDSTVTDTTGGNAGGFSVPIDQTINGLTVGHTYQLTFYQAAAQQEGLNGATTEAWQVEFCATLPTTQCTGDNVQESQVMDNASHGDIPWNQQTLTFTADAVTEVLQFAAVGTPNGEPPFVLLDGLDLQAIPEPGAYALIGLGLLAIPAAARWRKARR